MTQPNSALHLEGAVCLAVPNTTANMKAGSHQYQPGLRRPEAFDAARHPFFPDVARYDKRHVTCHRGQGIVIVPDTFDPERSCPHGRDHHGDRSRFTESTGG